MADELQIHCFLLHMHHTHLPVCAWPKLIDSKLCRKKSSNYFTQDTHMTKGSSWLIPSRLKGPLNINEGSASTSTRGDRLPRLSPIQLTSQEATGDESGDPVKLGSVLLKTRQFNVDHGWGFIWLYFVGGSFQHWLHLPQVRSNESWFLEIHSHWHPWPRHWVQWCCCFRILGCTVYWRGMRITPASKHWQSIWW